MHTDTKTCINACEKLLRGEISAVETYRQAIEKFQNQPEATVLADIQRDHEESASVLRNHLIEMGALPKNDSGIWGDFAKAVEGTAKIFGESTALAALIQGEKIGVSDYESALGDEGVMESIKIEIRNTLIPRLHNHISALEQLKA